MFRYRFNLKREKKRTGFNGIGRICTLDDCILMLVAALFEDEQIMNVQANILSFPCIRGEYRIWNQSSLMPITVITMQVSSLKCIQHLSRTTFKLSKDITETNLYTSLSRVPQTHCVSFWQRIIAMLYTRLTKSQLYISFMFSVFFFHRPIIFTSSHIAFYSSPVLIFM